MKNILFAAFLLFGTLAAKAQCQIVDLVATHGDCVNGQYYVTIDFEYTGVGNEGFKVQGNGNNYGTFQYSALPITLGPFQGNGVNVYEFVAKDVQFPDCSDFAVVGPINCNAAACEIYDFVVQTGDCNDDGTYSLTIDFEVQNPPHTHFDLIYEGQNIGYYALADLPITIPHFVDNGETGQVIKVCINDSDCCRIKEFQAPNCPGSGDCEIFDLVAEANPCNDNGQYMLDIAFQTQATGSQGFKVRANGQWFGPFSYGQPFYTIGPLNAGTVYEIVVRDVQYELCKDAIVFGPVNCGNACHIYDLVANASDCNDDGQFFVTINFQHDNTGNDGFKIYGNGNVYGFFNYDDLPVTIGPLTSNAEQLEFGAADASHPDCRDFAVVQVPDCDDPNTGDCQIGELVADVHPCLPNGMFYVTLDFQHENTSGYFKVRGNGNLYGIYSYDELPVEIGPLYGNGTTNYEFVVIDIHNENCRDDIGIGTVSCMGSGDCAVNDLIVDPSDDCHPDDTYNLWFWFTFENPGNNFYNVFHNGDLVGTYPLTQVPKTLQHLTANDELFQVLKICINDHPDCCMTVEYVAPNCDGLVYPGDGNRDNACDHFDLLNLGLGYGWEGPARSTQGLEWAGLAAANWPTVFENGVNGKYADCTGDGVVNDVDIAAIALNFGEINGNQQPLAFTEGNEDAPPMFVDLPSANLLQPGMTFTAPIMLGTEESPLDDIYGIAFTLKFDPEIISPSSIDLKFDPSWLGVQAVNLLGFDRTLADRGEVKMALVRTDHNNVSGHGQVAAIIGIIDNIAGKDKMSIEITEVKAIRNNEALVSLRKPVETVDLVVNGSKEVATKTLEVFPNPVNNRVNFQLPASLYPESAELWTVDGKLRLQTTAGANYLDVSSLAAGVYILRVKSGGQVYQSKLVK
ncbi:MAG: T9SS type A sorting domain-containing protein [Saprospiraceae bacterium]|nr:T9SS type A sorting domain-containing protein [Saprospiraceae bacterium]